MQYFEVNGHEPSLLPDGYKFNLVWADEFDGTELDMTKWSFRYHLLHKRQMCLTDETASLDGKGNLVLSLMEKDGHYYCSQLQTGENYLDRPSVKFEENGFQEQTVQKPYWNGQLRNRCPSCNYQKHL